MDNSDYENILEIGDRVDIISKSGITYRTMIEDQHEKGPFLLGIPSSKGQNMPVEEGDDIYLVFYRESGRYIAQMKVVALERRGVVRYMWLLQKAVAKKNQRREAYRLPIMFDVEIRNHKEDEEKSIVGGVIFDDDDEEGNVYETAVSKDLSITGVALITRNVYVFDLKYDLSMFFDRTPSSIRLKSAPESAPPIEVTATVKRSVPWRDSKLFYTGMQFSGMTREFTESVTRFVLSEQQKQIRKNRLL